MAKVQLQFHADPHEAVELGLMWAGEHGLAAVAERFFPRYEAVEGTGSAAGLIRRLGSVDRVALCRDAPDVTATSAHEFAARNADCLFLMIGGRSEEGVRESALGGVSEDPELLRTWRSLVRRAGAAMHSGATVRNPMSDRETRKPAHLHSPGAHELARNGVPMLASAGWNEYTFDDCAQLGVTQADRHPDRG